MSRHEEDHLVTRKMTVEYYAELIPPEAQSQYLQAVYELVEAYEQEIKRASYQAAIATRLNAEHTSLVNRINAASACPPVTVSAPTSPPPNDKP